MLFYHKGHKEISFGFSSQNFKFIFGMQVFFTYACNSLIFKHKLRYR